MTEINVSLNGRVVDLLTFRPRLMDVEGVHEVMGYMYAAGWTTRQWRTFMLTTLWEDTPTSANLRAALDVNAGDRSAADVAAECAAALERLNVCFLCGRMTEIVGRVDFGTGDGDQDACQDCFDRYMFTCAECQERQPIRGSVTLANSQQIVCDDCYRRPNYGACWHCQSAIDLAEGHCVPEDPYDEDDEYDQERLPVSDCSCYQCSEVRRSGRRVHSYSYKPMPIFHGDVRMVQGVRGAEYDSALYMGFELEVLTPKGSRTAAPKVLKGVNGHRTDESIMYLKSDGSINGDGFEMVTHPATLDWYMEHFNWSVLRDMRKAHELKPDASCGMHVHVSRNAFSGQPHELRWLQFFYRNQQIFKTLARRESTYARFDSTGREVFTKSLKDGVPLGAFHYDAVNRGNDHTYEVRIFASTLFVNRLKSNLQMVDATVEYTRRLTSGKVMKEGGYGFAAFLAWLNQPQQRARYKDFREECTALLKDLQGNLGRQTMRTNSGDHLGYDRRDNRQYSIGREFVSQEGF